MLYKKIQEYNKYLVNTKVNINIIYFINNINSLVSNNIYYIFHIILQICKILIIINTTNYIKKIFEKNNFKEYKKYLTQNILYQILLETNYKNEYYFKSKIFKLWLIKTKNIKLYDYYYLLLEIYIEYYKKYKDILNKKYIIKLTEKVTEQNYIIDKLQETINKFKRITENCIKCKIKFYNEEYM